MKMPPSMLIFTISQTLKLFPILKITLKIKRKIDVIIVDCSKQNTVERTGLIQFNSFLFLQY